MEHYRDLNFKCKVLTAKYVYKHLVKKGYTDTVPMSVWTERIKNLIIEKQHKFKKDIDWNMDSISSWRSIFDIILKNLKLVEVHTTKPISYSLL